MTKKLLIIEDDADTLELVHTILEEPNLRIISSFTLISVEQVKSIAPDLILLDHWVGSGLGGDLCLKLKKNSRTKHIKVIIFSAHPDLETVTNDSCADDYIQKPFDVDHMKNVIKKYI